MQLKNGRKTLVLTPPPAKKESFKSIEKEAPMVWAGRTGF